jgi:hypothetical protein
MRAKLSEPRRNHQADLCAENNRARAATAPRVSSPSLINFRAGALKRLKTFGF